MKSHIFLFLGAVALLAGTSADARVQTPKSSVLVCRAHQCALAEYSMTREFLFNKLENLFEKNSGKAVLLCDADPTARVCYNSALEMPADSRIVPTRTRIPTATIVDAKLEDNLHLNLILDFKVFVNQTKPRCQAAAARLSVPFVDKVLLSVPEFGCDLTASGTTKFNMNYHIDYVDFDYGVLGAYYTIGVGEVFRGGKTGYMLMRFTERMQMPDTTDIMAPHRMPAEVSPAAMHKDTAPDLIAPVRTYTVKEEKFVNGKKVSETITREPDSVLMPVEVAPMSVEYMPVYNDGIVQAEFIENRTRVVPYQNPYTYRGILTPAVTSDGIEASRDAGDRKAKFWNNVLNILYLGD